MGFKELVSTYQSFYTNFSVTGSTVPAGATMPETIKLRLPYFQSHDGIYGGKSSYADIQNAIRNKYFNTQTGHWNKSAATIQSEINSAPDSEKKTYGMDCSGLVYFVLNESTKPNTTDDMTKGALYSQFKVSYANGVSASNLSSTSNGVQKTRAQDMVVGCTMRSDNGGHVLVIYQVDKNSSGIVTKIYYAHSNGSDGPHTGTITIGDSTKDLKDAKQTWNDIAYTDTAAKNYYNYTILLNNLIPYAS